MVVLVQQITGKLATNALGFKVSCCTVRVVAPHFGTACTRRSFLITSIPAVRRSAGRGCYRVSSCGFVTSPAHSFDALQLRAVHFLGEGLPCTTVGGRDHLGSGQKGLTERGEINIWLGKRKKQCVYGFSLFSEKSCQRAT